jgi:hypothetical protein
MRSVNFDSVKAQRLCGARCIAIGLYRAANFVVGRWSPDPFERETVPSDDAGRAEAVVAAGTTVMETPHASDLRLADEPDVPELREDPGSRVVHLLNHPPPSVESVIAVDAGGVFIVSRAGMRDERAFSYDEADAALGSPPVITGDILTGHAPRRHGAGHWGHRDAVAQIDTADPSRLEQYLERVRVFHNAPAGLGGRMETACFSNASSSHERNAGNRHRAARLNFQLADKPLVMSVCLRTTGFDSG